MADIGALRELHAFMCEVRATYARSGELELRLESLPSPTVGADNPQPDTDEDERRSLETLLHSSGVDPEAFVAASKRLRAA